MNKLKRYICRGCALFSISSVIATAGYAYTFENKADYRNESSYAATISSIESDNSNKYKKRGTVVNVESILNVRKEPSVDSQVDSTLDNGETIHIIDEKEGWYEIEQNDSTGYVKSDYIEEHEDSQELIAVPLDNKITEDESTKSDIAAENLSAFTDSSEVKTENDEESKSDMQESVSAVSAAEESPKGKLINVELTAYCNDEQCSGKWGGTTAMGTSTRTGVVAAPSGITLGSRLYIPELSYYKSDAVFNVEDRGGAVKMKEDGTYIIDVWFPTHEQVEKFGRVSTTAYILE